MQKMQMIGFNQAAFFCLGTQGSRYEITQSSQCLSFKLTVLPEDTLLILFATYLRVFSASDTLGHCWKIQHLKGTPGTCLKRFPFPARHKGRTYCRLESSSVPDLQVSPGVSVRRLLGACSLQLLQLNYRRMNIEDRRFSAKDPYLLISSAPCKWIRQRFKLLHQFKTFVFTGPQQVCCRSHKAESWVEIHL